VRGEALFADLGCAVCHAGPERTDSGAGDRYDVGTITASSGSRRGGTLDGLDVPTLRGIHATAPYLHDGSAATLAEVLTVFNPSDAHGVTSPLAAGAVDDLVAFLLSLD
jgi:cytochrome c peroxidase